MKKQTKKTKKVNKTKARTLTQRIEALKALKVRRQKLSNRIYEIEVKLVEEVQQLRREIKTDPSQDPLANYDCGQL